MMRLSSFNTIYCERVTNLYFSRCSCFSTKASPWKTVVGLEVHAQILSNSKLFSGAKCSFNDLVNNCVGLLDASIPGTLPVLNKRCVEVGVLTASALSCKINPVSMFDRKHYFYADLPAGYQITQQRAPLAENGKLVFQVFTPVRNKKPYIKSSIIKQIQLEQDSGKSLHDEELGRSLVDLNRAGMPLMELVFEPDLEDGEEAAALVKELLLIFSRLGCCSGRMEEGALRVDANVSVHRPNEPFGTRTEIKNIGSVRGVANAITHESQRQIDILESGGVIYNETRSWDPISKVTVSMRDKEVMQDYRYMPEPNLPPLCLNMSNSLHPDLVNVVSIQRTIPELPEESRQRLVSEYGFTKEFAMQLVHEDVLYNYFNNIVKTKSRKPKIVANIILMELLTVLNKNKMPVENCNLPTETLGGIIDLRLNGIVNLITVVKILDLIVNGDERSPQKIVDDEDWAQINDEMEIEKICLQAIKDNPKLVNKYKNGNVKALRTFNSILIKQTNDKANMALAMPKLEELLKR